MAALPNHRRLALLIFIVFAPTSIRADPPASTVWNFSRDIRPILSDKCFRCHGPDEANRQGGLRLDLRASAMAAAESGSAAIRPKDAAASELVNRIFSDHADRLMPPADSQKSLTLEEKTRLRQWIEQGAAYEEHWAFQAPQRHEPPQLSQAELSANNNLAATWNANPIDRFLLRRMLTEPKGASPGSPSELPAGHTRPEPATGSDPKGASPGLPSELPAGHTRPDPATGSEPKGASPGSPSKLPAGHTRPEPATGSDPKGASPGSYADKLTPNPPADKATLLRRVALDLTGLPPSLEQQSLFLNDTSPGAYEAMVDRMLASPQYGERMAIQWLDFARYADSNGYQSDGSRDIWGWRDWVIHAYNANLPFDQFTIEQLAGDMLPNATAAQIIATGFNRNHRLNGEGGRIEAEWFVETVIDRVETTGLTWLGLTLNCCRCHDHKYDPISQKEFYQLFAYFNSVEESGVLAPVGKNSENTPPLYAMETAIHTEEIARREAELADIERQINEQGKQLPSLAAAWAAKTKEALARGETESPWKQVTLRSVESEGGATLQLQPDGSYLATGKNPDHDIYRLSVDVPGPALTGLLLEVFPDASLPNQSLGRGFNGNFILTDLEVTWSSKPQEPLAIDQTEADYSQDQWPAAALAKQQGAGVKPKNRKGWAIDGNAPDKRLPRKLMILLKEPATVPKNDSLVFRFGNSSTHADHNVGRFRLSIATGDRTALQLTSPQISSEVLAAIGQPAATWDAATRKLVESHYRNQADNPIRRLEAQLDQKKKELAAYKEDIPTTMVMKEGKTRDAFVLVRGEYDKPADKVGRALPAILPPLPDGASNDRLGLARWIVSPNNPLTARVWVNREWERFFGIGIVKTSENLGSQSEYPTHPELLDWLAVEFMSPQALPPVGGQPAHRWDMKALQKLILMSEAYKQSSHVDPSSREKDPDNRFVARGPRFRLSGEVVRDSALAASGLLVQRLGGPSVRPYMPAGVWDETSKYGNLRNYQHAKDDGRYRRSLYTIWKRTAAPPTMLLFDAPNREVCTVKRSRTNTPLQALSLLNEVTFVEAARALATELIQKAGPAPAERINVGYQRVVGRLPTNSEREILLNGLADDLRLFQQQPERAAQLVRVGDLPVPAGVPVEELAAYTLLANVLFNLDEFVTRE